MDDEVGERFEGGDRGECYTWDTAGAPQGSDGAPDREGAMAEGTIARLHDDRGFGFIRPDEGGADLFFHARSVQGTTFEELRRGQRVTYAPEPDPRNPGRDRAIAVRPAEAIVGD